MKRDKLSAIKFLATGIRQTSIFGRFIIDIAFAIFMRPVIRRSIWQAAWHTCASIVFAIALAFARNAFVASGEREREDTNSGEYSFHLTEFWSSKVKSKIAINPNA